MDVVVVGAGAAGIAAARRLARTQLSVQLIEAATRIGGRAWTCNIAGLPLDLGCEWLHSADFVEEVGDFRCGGVASQWRAGCLAADEPLFLMRCSV